MLILAIETSNPSCPAPGIALGRREPDGTLRTLALEPVAPASREADDLTPAIARALAAAGVRPADLGLVGVSVGPGGYTSLRMAAVTAQMLAEAAGVRGVAIPSAMVVAEAQPDDQPFAVALAGKRDAAHLTVFPAGWRRHPPAPILGRLSNAADLAHLPIARLVADQHLPAPLADAALARGLTISAPRLDPVCALALAARLPTSDPLALVPDYGREPEAVTLWRSRRGEP